MERHIELAKGLISCTNSIKVKNKKEFNRSNKAFDHHNNRRFYMASKIIPDDLITTINDFKSTSNGQMINIHGKEYATVAHRVAVLRRNLGAKLSITTEVVSINDNKVVVKATGSISGVVIATGHAEEIEKQVGSTPRLL